MRRRSEWQGEQQYNQQYYRYNRHPHYQQQQPSPGSWQRRVPAWEKRFCTTVCSIPWNKLCETKRLMSLYQDVVRWDDSEAAEAFHNAKARYWAQINGFYCDIPLPDLDKYINEVDHEERLEPQLVEDLYDLPPPPPDDGAGLNWDSFLFIDKPVPVSGWGDLDDEIPVDVVIAGLIRADALEKNGGANPITGDMKPEKDTDSQVASHSVGGKEIISTDSRNCVGKDGVFDENVEIDDHQQNKNSRKCTERRMNYTYLQALLEKPPPITHSGNSMRSCGPMPHQADGARQWRKYLF